MRVRERRCEKLGILEQLGHLTIAITRFGNQRDVTIRVNVNDFDHVHFFWTRYVLRWKEVSTMETIPSRIPSPTN